MVSKPRRRTWIGLSILLLLVGLWFGNYEYRVAPIRFEAGQWASIEPQNDSLHRRARMADWLLSQGTLSGKSRAQVVSMLGAPGSFRDWDFAYSLGAERGLAPVDMELLVLRFDNNDRVVEARILRD